MSSTEAVEAACLIGISAACEPARWAVWDQLADLAPRSYALSVQKAGGVAVLLPADPKVIEEPNPLLNRLDGLILAGGADLDPASYGADADSRTVGTYPERDRFEIALAKAALEQDLPVLGVCRGFQILNVATGGTLDQHLPDALGHDGHRTVPGQFDEHPVKLVEGSRVAGLYESLDRTVHSHHHQGLGQIGSGLTVTAIAIPDQIAEAVEVVGRSFALGVQWHPEIDGADPLVPALVKAARARMET